MFRSRFNSRVLVLALIALTAILAVLSLNAVVAKNKSAQKARVFKAQTLCPVMGGKINKSLYYDYQGKRIYVCCPACLGKLEKDPEKYIKKLNTVGQAVEAIVPIPAKDDSSMKGKSLDKKLHCQTLNINISRLPRRGSSLDLSFSLC